MGVQIVDYVVAGVMTGIGVCLVSQFIGWAESSIFRLAVIATACMIDEHPRSSGTKGKRMSTEETQESATPASRCYATLDDAIVLAKGCFDYGGGYRGQPDLFEAYHHGIQTVINVLVSAKKRGASDTQVNAVFAMGSAVYKDA